ncbi:MAG: PIN domain nuclease [Synechococcaceae cyanobacterium SM2_3_2]|nr:PIN domain nuclease [Synechococcaceae cyanobacterium SM2_3_2]
MILVDSSVWIDYFRGTITPQTNRLDTLLTQDILAIGNLILAEVLQGFSHQADFNQAQQLFAPLVTLNLVGVDVAVQSAQNFRFLSSKGITVRKTIDTLIATYCLVNHLSLLYSDRDFDPFVTHLGLQSALHPL